jgi:hypothetical protein
MALQWMTPGGAQWFLFSFCFFSPSLHLFMEQFHNLHGAKVILSPDEAVLIPF